MADNLEQRLAILLAKYESKSSSDNVADMTELGILRRENHKLKEVIDTQKEMIDIFRIKYLDLSIEYNERIEKIRSDHMNELTNLHAQFKARLKEERSNR